MSGFASRQAAASGAIAAIVRVHCLTCVRHMRCAAASARGSRGACAALHRRHACDAVERLRGCNACRGGQQRRRAGQRTRRQIGVERTGSGGSGFDSCHSRRRRQRATPARPPAAQPVPRTCRRYVFGVGDVFSTRVHISHATRCAGNREATAHAPPAPLSPTTARRPTPHRRSNCASAAMRCSAT